MCLLAAVDGWSSEHIQCRAHSHREADPTGRASVKEAIAVAERQARRIYR